MDKLWHCPWTVLLFSDVRYDTEIWNCHHLYSIIDRSSINKSYKFWNAYADLDADPEMGLEWVLNGYAMSLQWVYNESAVGLQWVHYSIHDVLNTDSRELHMNRSNPNDAYDVEMCDQCFFVSCVTVLGQSCIYIGEVVSSRFKYVLAIFVLTIDEW